jgi:hypothetical protein
MDRILPALSSPQMKSRMTAVDDLQVRRPPFASDATTPPSRRRIHPDRRRARRARRLVFFKMSRPPSPVVLAGRPLRRPLPHPRVSLPATDSTELHQTYLETNEVADRDEAAQISAALESLLKDNNAKVCEGALCAARNAVEGAPELFERHVPSFIGGVFDRLGDLKAPVREAGQRLLVTLMANGVRYAARFARLLPVRPRRRGERRSLRTFAVVYLRPQLARFQYPTSTPFNSN